MITLIQFAFTILSGLISALIFVIFANAIISWLVAFDVINLRNRAVSQIAQFLDAVCRPLLRPVQKIIPPLGGVDISPVIVLIVLSAIQRVLLPALASWLITTVAL